MNNIGMAILCVLALVAAFTLIFSDRIFNYPKPSNGVKTTSLSFEKFKFFPEQLGPLIVMAENRFESPPYVYTVLTIETGERILIVYHSDSKSISSIKLDKR